MAISVLCLGSMAAATITFVWEPVATATSYWLYRSSGTNAFSRLLNVSTNAAAWQFTDTNVQRFYVTAINDLKESGPSNLVTNWPTVIVSPPTNSPPITNTPPPTNQPPLVVEVPGAPTIIYVNRINGNRVDCGWSTQDLTTSSEVWRLAEGDPIWRLMSVRGPSDLHWSDTAAQQKKDFSYKVRSCASQTNCSSFSQVSTIEGK